MTLSYNLAYQEIISVHPTRFLLANHTLLSGTSENESYTLFKTPSDNVENSSNVSPKSMNLPEYFGNLVGSGTRVSDSNLLTPIKEENVRCDTKVKKIFGHITYVW